MYVSDVSKLVYLSPPRTGSTSMATVLVQAPFHARGLSRGDVPHDAIWQAHFGRYTLFITVRHPYPRAVSLWRFSCYHAVCLPVDRLTQSWRQTYRDGLPSFEGFLRFPNFQNTLYTNWRCSWHLEQMLKPVDFVVRQENFDQDLAKIPQLKGVHVPRLNSGPPNRYTWDHFYEQNPACLELVQNLWGDDFEKFGYEVDFEKCKAGNLFTESESLDC